MRRYVILGAGAAGISAAEAIRSVDSAGEILFVTEESHGYYSRPGLAYYLTGEVTEQMLFPFSKKDFQRLKVRLLHARAVRIDPKSHAVVNEKGAALRYDRLLIATGSMAIKLKVPGAQLQGVIKLDNLEDARAIFKLSRKGRTAVVAGGGITALEILEGLAARGMRVHYFLRGDRYWPNVLDAIESKIVEQRLFEHGVKIHRQTEIAEILPAHGRTPTVAGVRTTQGVEVQCNVVGVAIGVRPRKELAEASGIHTERGILANERMETNAADVFTAGDVAQVYDPLTGQTNLDSLWNPARQQGYVAGLNMAGRATQYVKSPAINVTRLAGITTTIIGTVGSGRDADVVGIARGDSETWRLLPESFAVQRDSEVNRLRIMVGRNTLIGAVVMGDQSVSHPLQHLIAEQVDISTIRESLVRPNAPVLEILARFWRNHATRQS